VAIGLAVADRLARRRVDFAGEVRYVFQPAEEGMGGALRMIEEGVLEGVDAALGLHVWLGLPSGSRSRVAADRRSKGRSCRPSPVSTTA
jgi:amidohydrolase